MARAAIKLETIGARELLERLERLRDGRTDAVLAFDADGTLWGGDVGIDAFDSAIQRRLLREEARAALSEAAVRHGLEGGGSASDLAARIFAAYRAGRFPELLTFEIMTWCYAGFSLDELGLHARDTVKNYALVARLCRELEPIFDWARSAGLRTIVISASPRRVIEEAATLWGFSPADIVAGVASVEHGKIAPKLASSLPYARVKAELGRELIGPATWLASFGDSESDLEMMRAAALGVAVRPKLPLRMRLPELEHVALLE